MVMMMMISGQKYAASCSGLGWSSRALLKVMSHGHGHGRGHGHDRDRGQAMVTLPPTKSSRRPSCNRLCARWWCERRGEGVFKEAPVKPTCRHHTNICIRSPACRLEGSAQFLARADGLEHARAQQVLLCLDACQTDLRRMNWGNAEKVAPQLHAPWPPPNRTRWGRC